MLHSICFWIIPTYGNIYLSICVDSIFVNTVLSSSKIKTAPFFDISQQYCKREMTAAGHRFEFQTNNNKELLWGQKRKFTKVTLSKKIVYVFSIHGEFISFTCPGIIYVNKGYSLKLYKFYDVITKCLLSSNKHSYAELSAHVTKERQFTRLRYYNFRRIRYYLKLRSITVGFLH